MSPLNGNRHISLTPNLCIHLDALVREPPMCQGTALLPAGPRGGSPVAALEMSQTQMQRKAVRHEEAMLRLRNAIGPIGFYLPSALLLGVWRGTHSHDLRHFPPRTASTRRSADHIGHLAGCVAIRHGRRFPVIARSDVHLFVHTYRRSRLEKLRRNAVFRARGAVIL